MTIERIKGAIAFTCDLDGCNEGTETGEADFAEAGASAKADGWKFRKRDDAWKHFCCQEHEEMDYRGQTLMSRDVKR